jgi:hypothetical protein
MLYGLMALIGSAAALTYTNLTEATKVLALTSVVGIHLALASWVTARENRGLR